MRGVCLGWWGLLVLGLTALAQGQEGPGGEPALRRWLANETRDVGQGESAWALTAEEWDSLRAPLREQYLEIGRAHV